ncbi:MAG TPA: hypothetical protein VGG40_07780 [Solirubrobacterales bacterium]|jgi:hypothetical protein
MPAVRPVHPLAWGSLVAVLATCFACASPAAAAPQPVHLGAAAAAFNSGSATAAGGCICTVAQFHDVGPTNNSYVVPFDGVLVASGFYVGNSVEPVDAPTAQVQTVHPTGASTGDVVSEGLTHSLLGLTKNTVDSFYERVPAAAGDVLAARFHNSGFIEATPYFFKTAASGDGAEVFFTPVAAGASLSGGGAAAERRLNLEAELEPDEDHDGYGDASQDLCLGSPIATAACSGTLFGSDLQGPRTALAGCGGGGCMLIQTSASGASTAAPFNGVVVRWRVLNASSGSFRARVVAFREDAGGGFLKYNVLRSSAAQSISAPFGPLVSKLSTFETRLPIQAGQYVALSGGGAGFQSSMGGATYFSSIPPDPLDGNVATGELHNGTVLYDADIEPDVDGDGYGDVSQDSCPADASIHEGSCPASAAGGGGGGGASASGASPAPPSPAPGKPAITGLAAKPKSFRAKPVGGIAARGATGTKLVLDLSAKATVALTVATKKGKRLWTLTRSLGPGRASIPYDGRYRRHGKALDLPPGSYRLTAIAGNPAGAGPAARATFTVLPPG